MLIPERWNNFTTAPHRVMFFGGALQTIAVMVWWLIELATRYGVAWLKRLITRYALFVHHDIFHA